MATTTLPDSSDKMTHAEVQDLRASVYQALAEAIAGGLPAPFSVGVHYFGHTDRIGIQLRMANNAPNDVGAWATVVGAEVQVSEPYDEGTPKPWRAHTAGRLLSASWHGWPFEIWCSVDEPTGGQS